MLLKAPNYHISSKLTKKWCWRGSPAGFGTSFGSLRHQVCTNFAGLPILSAISAFSRPSCQGLVNDLMRLDGITQDALIHCDSPGRSFRRAIVRSLSWYSCKVQKCPTPRKHVKVIRYIFASHLQLEVTKPCRLGSCSTPNFQPDQWLRKTQRSFLCH